MGVPGSLYGLHVCDSNPSTHNIQVALGGPRRFHPSLLWHVNRQGGGKASGQKPSRRNQDEPRPDTHLRASCTTPRSPQLPPHPFLSFCRCASLAPAACQPGPCPARLAPALPAWLLPCPPGPCPAHLAPAACLAPALPAWPLPCPPGPCCLSAWPLPCPPGPCCLLARPLLPVGLAPALPAWPLLPVGLAPALPTRPLPCPSGPCCLPAWPLLCPPGPCCLPAWPLSCPPGPCPARLALASCQGPSGALTAGGHGSHHSRENRGYGSPDLGAHVSGPPKTSRVVGEWWDQGPQPATLLA